ncbi:MAG: Kazal-type serine protease inhibitor domain-containing protein, partial [Bacteroidota bacterium]
FMNIRFTLGLLSLLLFLSLPSVHSQQIWPGDINNNGVVNGFDQLYWAVANGASGPTRPNASTLWQGQDMGNVWSAEFPDLTNYTYADVNGDGQVNFSDAEALNDNFQQIHGTLSPDPFLPALDDGSIELSFTGTEELIVANQSKSLGLNLASESKIYGFTFTLTYPEGSLRAEDGIQVGLEQNSFFNPNNTGVIAFVQQNAAEHKATITIVRTNQSNTEGEGFIAKVILAFSSLENVVGNELTFTISDLVAINKDLETMGMVASGFNINITNENSGSCPNTIAPVCGSNGVTYLNSCFAMAAGISDYTEGTCFGSACIAPNDIDPDAVCPAVYEPVCGCNGITYSNQCAADAAGVQSTTSGPCNTSSTCYDPQYVVSSSQTSVDGASGVITTNASSTYNPVCGCNGVTYTNAFLAQASGITVYTSGTCESACIDPTEIDPGAICTTDYDPVCGCNGVTYTNSCRADAAGVTSYSNGPCSGNSSWCAEAIPVQCGDFLPYETTIGAGNNILNYPGCSGNTFLGADRVYVVQNQTAGDLQIGLEILTPGLDLDLFLLADNCNQISCLARSTTNNSVTNNEGIILEDAPIGTYYIVVDGQHPSSQGNFRLEVSCGYLFCGDAVPLTCGTPYYGSNQGGHDDVSLYQCGNVLNVENNGPEIVHTFTTTQAGPVNIHLAGLTANLELFLLQSCDRGNCMEYSQNGGTQNEHISAYLPAGTYYVVVDGYNGAIGNYTLTVDCSSACDFVATDISATPSSCGGNTGTISVASSGGTPNYLVTYSGPLSGSFTTSANSCTIYHLPPGTYTVTKTDAQGCSISGNVTILGGGNLSAQLTPNDAVCMSLGSIGVLVSNGQAPYHVYLNGPVSGSTNVNSNNFTINDLSAGDYNIIITDANGCSLSQQLTVGESSGNFVWDFEVSPANCGNYGQIHIDTYNGYPPYTIVLNGPASGVATVYPSSFNLVNLPGGTYEVTVEDNNWCRTTRTIVVPDGNLNIESTPTAGTCGSEGSITVNVANGTGNYNVSWTGPESGSTTTNSTSYVIPNLTSGDYTISVSDAGGCSDAQNVTVASSEGDELNINVIPLPGSCSQNGALWIDIYTGVPGYTVSYTGPESGTVFTNSDGLDIANLPCGTYTVTITDMNGCSGTVTTELGGCDQIDVDLTPTNGLCGEDGSLLVTINGGSPTYTVSWSGAESGQTTTSTNTVNIPNLSAGTYSVQVTDAGGCTDYAIAQISTSESNLNVSATVSEATCSSEGQIGLTMSGGTGPYQINWTGPESGTATSNNVGFTIASLAAGTYQIYVTDANGCGDNAEVIIENTASNLDISLTGNDGICGQVGNIGVLISNGNAPYQVVWSGPASGSAST